MKDSKIFVNFSTKNLDKAKEFYQAIGCTLNYQFTDEKAASVVINDNIYLMVITEEFFNTFIPGKKIIDTSNSVETILALSAESREEVDALLEKVIKAGGKEYREPFDHGFMYGRAFEDLDGHIRETFWMDEAHVEQQ